MKTYTIYIYPNTTETIEGASHVMTDAGPGKPAGISIRDSADNELAWWRLDTIQGYKIEASG